MSPRSILTNFQKKIWYLWYTYIQIFYTFLLLYFIPDFLLQNVMGLGEACMSHRKTMFVPTGAPTTWFLTSICGSKLTVNLKFLLTVGGTLFLAIHLKLHNYILDLAHFETSESVKVCQGKSPLESSWSPWTKKTKQSSQNFSLIFLPPYNKPHFSDK